MPVHIIAPTRVTAAGNLPKLIDEYVGRMNDGTSAVSIAHMRSPAGWIEPGQTPDFDEYTVVLRGSLRVTHRGGAFDVRAGEAVVARRGEMDPVCDAQADGAEYIAVCVRPSPGFGPARHLIRTPKPAHFRRSLYRCAPPPPPWRSPPSPSDLRRRCRNVRFADDLKTAA
jgi:mannose-6-phosphate isomerase-like protein (cupin superfamily)